MRLAYHSPLLAAARDPLFSDILEADQ